MHHVLLCTGDRSAQTKLIRRGNIIECHQVKIFSYFETLSCNLISIEIFIRLVDNLCHFHVRYTCFFSLVLTTILTISTHYWLLKGLIRHCFFGEQGKSSFFCNFQKKNAWSQVKFYKLMKVAILYLCYKMIFYSIPLTITIRR